MGNNMSDNIFLSRENIATLNSYLTKSLNSQNDSRENKKKYVKILISNMRKVYSKLKKDKLENMNNESLQKVLKKFNTMAFQYTLNEINNQSNTQENFNNQRNQNSNQQ